MFATIFHRKLFDNASKYKRSTSIRLAPYRFPTWSLLFLFILSALGTNAEFVRCEDAEPDEFSDLDMAVEVKPLVVPSTLSVCTFREEEESSFFPAQPLPVSQSDSNLPGVLPTIPLRC